VLSVWRLNGDKQNADGWGLHWNACATRRTLSSIRTVRERPGGFLLTKDAVVLNCVTQFNIVWHVGTFPFLPMSKSSKNMLRYRSGIIASKNVSTANARCLSDQRCMMTEGFKPLYPAMCVSLCHLQRCWHGAKCKSSNCFCPTLYMKMTSGTNLMQQLWFIIINISTCFGHLYAHLQEYRLYVTAYGVQHCKDNQALAVGFILCCSSCCVIVGSGYAIYWVQVPHNTCYAHWSVWKCSGGAGACSVWLP